MTRLIIHADDFGETEEITKGILTALDGGVVSSTSIMANMPGTDSALKIARVWQAEASFGVHLNFCEGKALSGCSTLTNRDGYFLAKRQIIARALLRKLRIADVVAEIRAQIDRIGSAGIRISHVDGHKHLHQLPVVRDGLMTVLPEFRIDRVRVTAGPKNSQASTNWRNRISEAARNRFGVIARKLFMSNGLRSPNRFIDIVELMQPDHCFKTLLDSGDEQLIVEIGCHPGTHAAKLEKPGSCDRPAELDFLMSAEFKRFLASESVKLSNYWDV